MSTSPSPYRAALLAAGATVALALGSCAPGDDDEAPPAAAGPAATDVTEPAGSTVSRYVALGDSFAALGPTDAPTSGPAGCLRSSLNYPSVLADRIGVADFVDATCGGARTRDMTARQIEGTPPQFDALTPDTDLVTLSIGGNDIGFGAIAGCVAQTPRSVDGAPCRERLAAGVSSALEALDADLDAVHAGIRERSPGARVVVTAYMPLVPADGGCDFLERVSPADVSWARDVTDRVNRAVSGAAARAGAEVTAPDDADERHACAPADVRYTDFTGSETGSHPMHPTAAGQRAMAAAVAGSL
ncbi:SGNH/GDSL hydrolase family protein [Dietzia sp. B32]|uniref:SGNH/GDSL hydrolase family protein n=1 Tax=Dietzia sp. B32 TaxID=2915130 RepID=UPI0021AD8D1C|nr:SGNH/GDSL hydrolase family protein [Dietzia sp. B32]UVE96146.1 SGNH/GDSL hydrolase family protein [Dietzia sp. B32]